MSKKSNSEVADNSADTVMDGVLYENQAKLNKLNSSIQAAYERRRKIITDSKLYTYDKLSQLYDGAEGLVDSSDGTDKKSGDDADSDSADDELVGQTSFFGDNSYKDY